MADIVKRLAEEFGIKKKQVEGTVKLIDENNTIPFIARYRKEVTGGLSDEILRDLNERLEYLRNLEDRKEEVKRLIDEQGKLTEELSLEIEKAETVQKIDDIYRPYRPKRRTRASAAREKGLEPLAEMILSLDFSDDEIQEKASEFEETESAEEALQGAMDIIAEDVSDDADIREEIRNMLINKSSVLSEKTDEAEENKDLMKYDMYFDFSEKISKIADHRVLALNRAESEKAVRVKIEPLEETALKIIRRETIGKKEPNSYILEALEDGYKRLLFPSLEREIRNMLTEKADEQAIKVFGKNLKPLLMQPPVQDTVVMGFDPGYRTGCKAAVMDGTGKLLDYATVYPTKPREETEKTKDILKKMVKKYGVEIIAIGNGTASRESEAVIAEMIGEMDEEVYYTIVNEAGASIYSASKLGTEEYPDIDVTIRGAISIGKRVQDPLAELVKIEPKHIGVGQYQHDINQKKLDETLAGVVESCVNSVGVDLNTASPSLLGYVAGINASVAKNILDYRNENGKFKSRKELLDVKRLGKATFEQCAGFLRIPDADNILDRTAVHPESYKTAESLLKKLGDVEIKSIDLSDDEINELADELEVGEPTLRDIIEELKKPGRDPREDMPKPVFRSDVLDIDDLKEGMVVPGTVRNVVDFGAFVDIGIKNDCLVHISEISNKFIKDVSEYLETGDTANFKIIGIDKERGRVQLSLKQA